MCVVLAPAPMTFPGGWGCPASSRGFPREALWCLSTLRRGWGEDKDCFSYSLRSLSHASVSSSTKNHPKSQAQTDRSFIQRLKTEQLAEAGQWGLGCDAVPRCQALGLAECSGLSPLRAGSPTHLFHWRRVQTTTVGSYEGSGVWMAFREMDCPRG